MSKIFIYYSFSGNGDAIAEKMCKKGFEIRKVRSSLKLSDKMLPQMLKGGFSALIGQTPALIDYDNNISDYDEVCIGAPVWNARLASPVNTIFRDTDFSGKKLWFILYSGSGAGKKAEEKIKKLYPDAVVLNLKQPKANPDELSKLNKL